MEISWKKYFIKFREEQTKLFYGIIEEGFGVCNLDEKIKLIINLKLVAQSVEDLQKLTIFLFTVSYKSGLVQ